MMRTPDSLALGNLSFRAHWLLLGTLSCLAIGQNSVCHAEEPFKQFLARLREEGMYDVGLKYLDISAAKNRIPSSMKEDLPLERILLLQDSLSNAKTIQQQDDRFIEIEKGYKQFLASAPNHPRRSEAQTKLGNLLYERAISALAESKKDENKGSIDKYRQKSRDAFTQALELYNKIVDELKPILESMRGDKIKPNDTEGKERRERYQNEYRSAQILSAKMMEQVAHTYGTDSAEYKSWLQKSESSFSQIIDKTSATTEAGPRMLTLLYRAEVQAQLGKTDEARDSFTRVADNDGPGIFRTWKAQAVAGITRLDAGAGKFEAAIEKGEETLKSSTANERNEAAWSDLQLAIAEARIAWAGKMEKKDENKFRNNRKVAREHLQAILKRQSSRDPAIVEMVSKAKTLLADLGIEIAEKVDAKLPETRNFEDSFKAARERLNRAEDSEKSIVVLEQQLAQAEKANQAKIEADITSVKKDVLRDRNQAIELYQRALRQAGDKDSRDDLLESRFYLSYLLLRTEQYWESVAIAQELMISAKGTDRAEKGASFALMGLSKLLVAGDSNRQSALLPALESLSRRLVESSPQSDETQNAIDLLVRVAIVNKRYGDAEKYIGMLPQSAGSGAAMLGQILWSEYRKSMQQHRIDKTEETQEDKALKDRAEKLLRGSWDKLDAGKAEKVAISGANSLASLYLSSNRIDEAIEVLENKTRGAFALAQVVSEIDSTSKLESYRLKLQAVVEAVGQGKRELGPTEVKDIVDKMKALSGDDASLLSKELRNLAFDLQLKLDATKDVQRQIKLGQAYGVVVQQLVGISSDVATLDAAGTSIFVVASGMIKDPATAMDGKALMSIAEEAFSKVATKPELDLIEAKRKPEEFQMKLGLSKSGAGKNEEAHKVFAEQLAKNPSNLTLQIEAARNLQSWSKGTDAELLRKAIMGTEPNDKKKNQIWGWGQIGQVTSSRINDFKDAFFESRLNIARCRRQIAMTETAEKKKKLLEDAVADIRRTYKTYPELGGPEIESQFNKLLTELQQDLGRPAIGLSEFKQASNSN